jgi:hypothetical protein
VWMLGSQRMGEAKGTGVERETVGESGGRDGCGEMARLRRR